MDQAGGGQSVDAHACTSAHLYACMDVLPYAGVHVPHVYACAMLTHDSSLSIAHR